MTPTPRTADELVELMVEAQLKNQDMFDVLRALEASGLAVVPAEATEEIRYKLYEMHFQQGSSIPVDVMWENAIEAGWIRMKP